MLKKMSESATKHYLIRMSEQFYYNSNIIASDDSKSATEIVSNNFVSLATKFDPIQDSIGQNKIHMKLFE